MAGRWRSARQRSISARTKLRWPPGVRRQATLPASPQRRSVLGLTPSSAAASARRIQSRRVISFGAGSRISRPIGENGGELNHLYHTRPMFGAGFATVGGLHRLHYLAIPRMSWSARGSGRRGPQKTMRAGCLRSPPSETPTLAGRGLTGHGLSDAQRDLDVGVQDGDRLRRAVDAHDLDLAPRRVHYVADLPGGKGRTVDH